MKFIMRNFQILHPSLVFLGFAVFGGTALDATVVTFQTGSFAPAEWSSHIAPGSTGTASATTQGSGGNPGAYRRVSLMVDPFEHVQSSQLWSVAQFDPSSQGAITSVLVSYDLARVFTSHPGATQIAKGIAVRQSGVIYSYFGGVSTVVPPNWQSFTVNNIVPLFPSVNWTSGSAITFGFYDSVSTSAVGFTIDGGYDNFRVQIEHGAPVPEPSTYIAGAMLLLPAGVQGLRAWRHRKRAA